MMIDEPAEEYFAALSISVQTTSLTAFASTRTTGSSFSAAIFT
jgi:hypothetical protein